MNWQLIGWMKGDFRLDNPKRADDYITLITPTAGGACLLNVNSHPFLQEFLKMAANMAGHRVQPRVRARGVMFGIRATHSPHVSLLLQFISTGEEHPVVFTSVSLVCPLSMPFFLSVRF